LGVGDSSLVFLVSGRLGGLDPLVWSGGIAGGWHNLLSPVQHAAAKAWLSCRRCCHYRVPFGTFAHEWLDFPYKKNKNFCKK